MKRHEHRLAMSLGCIVMAIGLSSCVSTEFIVSGANGGSISSNPSGTWVSCAPCELYEYNPRTGGISPVARFSDDAASLSYLAGSISYDPVLDQIDFLGSVSGSGDDAAIYTVDASSGHTIRKVPYDYKKYGLGETLFAGKRGHLLPAQ